MKKNSKGGRARQLRGLEGHSEKVLTPQFNAKAQSHKDEGKKLSRDQISHWLQAEVKYLYSVFNLPPLYGLYREYQLN